MGNSSFSRRLHVVNPSDAPWTRHRYILWFDCHAPIYLMVWANYLENALEECNDWIEHNAPGLYCDDIVREEYARAIADGKSTDEAIEYAEMDTTSLDGGHYLRSDDWGLHSEDPTRERILTDFEERGTSFDWTVETRIPRYSTKFPDGKSYFSVSTHGKYPDGKTARRAARDRKYTPKDWLTRAVKVSR